MLYNKYLFWGLFFFLISCQEAELDDLNDGIKFKVNISDNYKINDTSLNFSDACSLFADLLYLSERLKKDSIGSHDYLDSARAIGILLILQKYKIDTSQLRGTLNSYFSNIDTSLFFIYSVQRKMRNREKNMDADVLKKELLLEDSLTHMSDSLRKFLQEDSLGPDIQSNLAN